MKTFIRYRLRSLFVGAGLAMLLAAEPAQAAEEFSYLPSNSVVLPLFMDTRANASSLPGTGWYTTAIIQNTSASTAYVRVTAKPKQGVTGGDVRTFSILARGFKVVRPDNPTGITNTVGMPGLLPAGNFEGSLLIESSQPLIVIGELTNIPLGSMGVAGGIARGFYNGILVNESVGTLAFPMMKSGFNGKSTVVYVKNTSTTPGSATIKLKTNDGMTYNTDPMLLDAGQSKAVAGAAFKSGTETWTKTCSGGANVGQPGAACFGAALLESNTANVTFSAVAVQRVVAETSPSPSVHVANFQPVATGPVSCSVFRNAYQTTARSGVNIMNAGTSTVDITLKLINAATQTPYIQTFQGVPPNTGVLPGRIIAATTWAGNIGGFPDGAIGAATITSTIAGSSTPDNRIVAAVSESGVGTAESSYQCSGGSTTIFAPFVKFGYSDPNRPIPDVNQPLPMTSEVRLQNTGTAATTLTVTYKCGTNRSTTYWVQKTVAAGSSVDINSASFITAALPQGIPTNNICYAVVTSSASVVGTVTERSSSPSSVDDATYEFQRLRSDSSSDGNPYNPCPPGPLSSSPDTACSSGVCCNL